MKRTLKLIFRNLIIYMLAFVMFFGSAINSDTISLLQELIVLADTTYDGEIDVGNPGSAAGGIISTPCYGYPPIRVSVVYDKNTQLMSTGGEEAFYDYWGKKYPVTTKESNMVQGSFYLVTQANSFFARGVNSNNLYAYKYEGGDIENKGLADAVFLTDTANESAFGTNGVYYSAIKNIDKGTLASTWKQYATNKVRSSQAWFAITSKTGDGSQGGGTSIGMGSAYNAIFNPSNYKSGGGDSFTSAASNEAWYRTLDALMSLYTIAHPNQKAVWEQAVKKHINGEPVAIMAEIAPCLVFNSRTANESFGVIPAIDYISYCAGVTTGNLIYGNNWYKTNNSFKGDIYGAITSSVNKSIAESPQKNRYPSTGHYATNAWSWGLTALTKNSLRTTPSGISWEAPTVPTAFIEALGITGGSGIWKAGYTIFGTSGTSPLTGLGVLSATPDNYHLPGATFGVNATLTLYGGVSEEDLGPWETMVESARHSGGNFTIRVNWSRDSGRETDGSGIGTFVDPNIAAQDPFLPSNSVHMSAAEDAKAATVVNNPTIVIFSADEMQEWVSGRRAITAYDAIAGFKVMHTNTKILYIANLEVTLPNGEVITGQTSDYASFLMHEERIGYSSTPQAYTEFKNYGVNSNMNCYLEEDFEAMAGVPSTEQMYFAAGGSEFIVDVGLNEAADETAYRTYDYYFTETNCEYQSGDQSNEGWSVTPTYSGILCTGSDYSLNIHGGDLQVSVTISGTIRNDNKGSVSGSGTVTAPAAPNGGDIADRASAYASLVAWYNAASQFQIYHTSVSDQKERRGTIGSLGSGSLPGCPSVVPTDQTASNFIDVPDGKGGTTQKPGPVTVSYDGDKNWSVTASITLPCHVICGPCCEHVIPETHDTWTQSIKYDSLEINNVHVWRIDQAGIEGMEDIIGVEYVSADILRGDPTIFYNIAYKNESTYKNKVFNDKTGGVAGGGSNTHHAKTGRMVYSLLREQLDDVVVCLGSRQPNCDGLVDTCGHNKIVVNAQGHRHFWAEGFIYTLSNEGFGHSRTGNPSHGETAFSLNPRNTLNNARETYGSDLSKNVADYHSNHAYTGSAFDEKNTGTPEYQAFVQMRNQTNTATMVTDFLILQTTTGDQSVMYYDQSQTTYVDAEMPNIDALNNPYNRDNQGALRNEVNGIDATAIPGGPIANRYWFGNSASASGWDAYEINIGSYTGMYWKGNEGNSTNGATKFDGTGRSNAIPTKFDDGPHNSMVMVRPGIQPDLMMYTGEINLLLDNQNEAYYTGFSEVFFSNQLHWVRSDWLRLNPEKAGLHLPFVSADGTSIPTNFARLDTGTFVFDGDTPGRSYFFYDTNKRVDGGNNVIQGETFANHQFGIGDYIVAAGYTQEAVYSDSLVGGSNFTKCNDLIIHDPVSTEDTALVSLPQYRDQRTGQVVGGAKDVTSSINESQECPEEPGLCSYRVLNCHFLEDEVIFETTFTPDSNGYFVNKKSGNSLTLQPGFTLDRNNNFDGYALRAYGTRISIPFTEMDFSYNTSSRIRVEADIIINPTGKGQMIFSFNQYDLYLPESTEHNINENRCLTLNTGNGWERKVNIPVADGKKHHIAVDFAFNSVDNCRVYVDGVESSLQRLNSSVLLTPNMIGSNLNIGSWGLDDNYGANFWLDNLKVTRLAGSRLHGEECYTKIFEHSGGDNAHNHTADCLDVTNVVVAPGMQTKTVDGKIWGRIFYHDTAGGFFKDANEAENTNGTYKYSALGLIQDLKPKGDTKYTFELYYPETGQRNIWKQTERPQDAYLADTVDGAGVVNGYEAISIGMTGNYWGGLARSTASTATFIDGSTAHGNWFYAIGAYTQWGTGAVTIPGGNSTSINKVEIWMLLDDTYKNVNESEVSTTFNYTGNVQEFTVPISGYYRIEAWGASGGAGYYTLTKGSHGGQGGYTAGTVYLIGGTTLYVYVGEAGTYTTSVMNDRDGSWNGGGARYGSTACGSATGGGASDVRLTGGPWDNDISLKSRILVAGGGGGTDDATNEVLGGSNDGSGGAGGGLVGENARINGSYSANTGGGQTSGAAFGKGGDCGCATDTGSGGGGWYGGVATHNNNGGAGGGSSYVSRYPGCDTRYLEYQGNYTFSNVSLTQGGNIGNGKVVITRMTSTLQNVMYWLYSGEKNEAELREYLGDAYDYVIDINKLTELYTYSNWYNSNNGFYHVTNGVKVNINIDGSFNITPVVGWECASATDIDGEALREIIITYKGGARPDTSTGVQFVFDDGSTSNSFYGTYEVNENGDNFVKITLDQSIYGKKITAIKYDLGSGAPTTKSATVKSIQINGHGKSSTTTKKYTVSTSNTPGVYTYETNAFGNSAFDLELIGAKGGDARIVNTSTVVKDSGGVGASVFGKTQFGGNDLLTFIVGGKGNDQASTASVTKTRTLVKSLGTSGSGSFNFKANKIYMVEMYGASGGSAGNESSRGGYGGYTSGILQFNKDTTGYYYVGGQGTLSNEYGTGGGYNGGGNAGPGGYGGGGMTHLSLTDNKAVSVVNSTTKPADPTYYESTVYTSKANGEARTDGPHDGRGTSNSYQWKVLDFISTVSGTMDLQFYCSNGHMTHFFIRDSLGNETWTADKHLGNNNPLTVPMKNVKLEQGKTYSLYLYSYCSAFFNVNVTSSFSTSGGVVATYESSGSWNPDGTLMVAGGGGGADSGSDTYLGGPEGITVIPESVGSSGDGSGGNGGGTTGGNATIDGASSTSTTSIKFDYSGEPQEFVAPVSGYYTLEAFGASGGLGYGTGNPAGLGGYTKGTTYLNKGDKIYVYVGQHGISYYETGSAAWNGGGAVYDGSSTHKGGSGGGATDFRLVKGAWNDSESLQSRILVAGGGGGAQSTCGGTGTTAGHGGGLTGGRSDNGGSYPGSYANGGTQSAGGTGYSPQSPGTNTKGGFGYGAKSLTCAAGGGGGYYGGGSSYTAGGGGGSSYVTGYTGCDTTYRSKQGGYNFTNVTISQGTNDGHGYAIITAPYVIGAGGTQSSGFMQGVGESATSSSTGYGDVAGAGAGWYGGEASNHGNGGAGGGSGYLSDQIIKEYGGYVSKTTQSKHSGNGAIYIYEISTDRTSTDGTGGYNGGGNGGIEYNEGTPESAAGGGGSTDLIVNLGNLTGKTVAEFSNFSDTSLYYGNGALASGYTDNGYDLVKSHTNDKLTVTKKWTDGWIYAQPGNPLLSDTQEVNCIELRIKLPAGANKDAVYHQLLYTTQGYTSPGDNIHCITFTSDNIVNESADGFITYRVVPTPNNLRWGESTITNLRLDLCNGIRTGDYVLDHIKYLNIITEKDMVAGGGGGAGSHLTANKVDMMYGGNASLLDAKAASTNIYTEAGTPSTTRQIQRGQDGSDGNRNTNSGGVGGGGGGYFGAIQVATNPYSNCPGGAGGGSFASGIFTNTTSSNKTSPDGSGNGFYRLEEYRQTLIIDKTNYDEQTAHVLMQYYTLIPDTLSDGSPNPLWSNCTGIGNYHKCTADCKDIRMLTCSEPHHSNLHYDIANKICWEACMNDANHKQPEPGSTINVSNNIKFTVGNFINIDYGLTIFFPNRGDFDEGECYAIGSLTSAKGLGFRNIYEVDEDYSDRPYGRGTDMSSGYVNTAVGMNTSKWTRVKRIKLPVNVIYDPTRDGKHAKLYLAGEWITLGDRGTYTSQIGGIGDTPAKGKYDEKAWTNYGTWKYDGIYKEFYNFYCVLNNPEIKAGAYTVEVTALNAKDFSKDGAGQKNDNPDELTNKRRTSSFRALHGGTNTQYFDVVGRIGNLIMEDVEDFRFSNLFKQTIDSTPQTQVKESNYYVNKGLGIKDSANSANNGASIDGNYAKTNAGNAFIAVKGVAVGQKFYKVVFEGKGLNVGRFEAVNVATGQPVDDNKLTLIQSSSTKVSYYLDLSKDDTITKCDLKFIAKGSNVMSVNKCSFTELGTSPDSWLLDGIVREVDENKQNVYLSWIADIRGIKVSSATSWVDTWGTLSWVRDVNDKRMDLPLSPDKNNINILKDEPMLAGYSALMDIQTIGSYWANDTTKLQIIPKYWALDVNTGLVHKLDVYMEHEGNYVPINYADNINKNNSALPFNKTIFDNQINLDWDNTRLRRNVTALESTKTQMVYEDSIRKESDQSATGNTGAVSAEIYRPIDVPSGHIDVLGNNQFMVLDGNARSFVGGVETYGEFKNLGNRLNPIHWYRSAQRWHFLVGIPSSAVFVFKGDKVTSANIDKLQSGPYVIICTLDITAIGEVYALKYEQKYSGSHMASDYSKYYQNIVKRWTDIGTSGGKYMGKIQVTAESGSTSYTKTFDLNNYAEQLGYEPIVLVYSVNERSVQDVEIVGTH